MLDSFIAPESSSCLLGSSEKSPGKETIRAPDQLLFPARFQIIEVFLTVLVDKMSLHFIEILQFPPHALYQELGLVSGHHVAEAGVVQTLAVPLDGPEVVSSLFLVVQELLSALLLPAAVVADQQLAPRLQSLQDVPVYLSSHRVREMHDGVAAVDNVIEVCRKFHLVGILDVEVDSMLDLRLHGLSVFQGEGVHVGGQVNTMDVHSILSSHEEGGAPGPGADVKNLHAWLQV